MIRIIAFILGLFRWVPWLPKPLLIRYSEGYPNTSELADKDFVIVRSGGFTKWACFLCPCGCGERISLSLMREQRPSWRFTSDWLGRPSVSPSVWQTAGCYSHFWIRRGIVDWCPGTGTPYRESERKIPCEERVGDMSKRDEEYLADLRKHAGDVRTLLSNPNKPERERMIVRAFLRCLGVSFSDDEIRASTEEPVDVGFRSAQFQIMEIVGDKRRGDEWRKRQERYDRAKSISDVTDPRASSEPISFSELSRHVMDALAKKAAHYGGIACAGLDALVYVDLAGRHLFPPDPVLEPEVITELNRQRWRSVSVLSVPYAAVLAAAPAAPDFLRNEVGLLANQWPVPDGWFDID